jgi:predicted RND superfamily exporter protein
VAIAVTAIAGLLLLLWRRPGDVVRALVPLVLAGIWTVGFVAALDLAFNFVNVVVLPLLVGIGVDSGIHLVGRARAGLPPDVGLTETATARAVFWSAATTLVSFGSLAFSAHRGIASLGLLLVIGMSFTLVANLVVLPAMLRVSHPAIEAAGEIEEAAS